MKPNPEGTVQVPTDWRLRPQSTYIESTLRSKYMISEYMEPLGNVVIAWLGVGS